MEDPKSYQYYYHHSHQAVYLMSLGAARLSLSSVQTHHHTRHETDQTQEDTISAPVSPLFRWQCELVQLVLHHLFQEPTPQHVQWATGFSSHDHLQPIPRLPA
uniref:Uncharacterized protein n=1 Tax=Cacopsylla melanoneura TaxID=428564 RepID=A0A8D8T8R7_9HEMI